MVRAVTGDALVHTILTEVEVAVVAGRAVIVGGGDGLVAAVAAHSEVGARLNGTGIGGWLLAHRLGGLGGLGGLPSCFGEALEAPRGEWGGDGSALQGGKGSLDSLEVPLHLTVLPHERGKRGFDRLGLDSGLLRWDHGYEGETDSGLITVAGIDVLGSRRRRCGDLGLVFNCGGQGSLLLLLLLFLLDRPVGGDT